AQVRRRLCAREPEANVPLAVEDHVDGLIQDVLQNERLTNACFPHLRQLNLHGVTDLGPVTRLDVLVRQGTIEGGDTLQAIHEVPSHFTQHEAGCGNRVSHVSPSERLNASRCYRCALRSLRFMTSTYRLSGSFAKTSGSSSSSAV